MHLPGKFHEALQRFGEALKAKYSLPTPGDPEDQLRNPVEQLFLEFGALTQSKLLLKGQSGLAEKLGKPDFAANTDRFLLGYIELKAPGKGADPTHFKGHDLEQWGRFRNVPNMLYTDGNEWSLFRAGALVGRTVRLSGDVQSSGKVLASPADARDLFTLLTEFLDWKPLVPARPRELAEFLAPYCLLIREEVLDSLRLKGSPLQVLKKEINALLFPDASDQQFADAYAQTIVFALLLAHVEGADVLALRSAYDKLASQHLLLSRALEFLTDPQAFDEIATSVGLTQRVIHEIPIETLTKKSRGRDPWLFFYEHFLASYDPALRKGWGVYYTPIEVVNCQVRLIDDILRNQLGREMGYVEPGVITLDPAVGTGTYLLGIIEHALSRVEAEEGAGAVKGGARSLVQNLYGFEWMVGPYAVAQLRFTRAIAAYGSSLPPAGPGIYLTNTLESPHTRPPVPPLFHQPIAQEHERALKIKDSEHVLICLGNPPYGRHPAATEENRATTGGWVRFGGPHEPAILETFLDPARRAGHGVHLKNLYNLYVYFLRWALWKVFEHKSATGPGIVSFITASSYLDGEAFVGVREHIRRICDEVYIIDLGGEGRGSRPDENVFAIQTPVCILVAWRKQKARPEGPATVRFTRIEGTRAEKLSALEKIYSLSGVEWSEAPAEWHAPFRPASVNPYSTWPRIEDIFPWQHSGSQLKRSWPIATDPETLVLRWKTFIESEDKARLFKETRDRKVTGTYPDLTHEVDLPSLSDEKSPVVKTPVRYAFRSFDRQFVIPDNRLGDYFRPILWQIQSDRQLYFGSSLSFPLGQGPALTIAAAVPDLHYFCNRGGKDIIPLYRDPDCRTPNVVEGLLAKLSADFGRTISAEDLAAYVYGTIGHSGFTEEFHSELLQAVVRLPLTKNAELFSRVAVVGRRNIWLHTFGEGLSGGDLPKGRIPEGSAKCIQGVSEDRYPESFSYDASSKQILVGDGKFGPVEPSVYNYEISGLFVVQSWLGYRMHERSGKKSSELDRISPSRWSYQFTSELLKVLWILEETIATVEQQCALLREILDGPLYLASELPLPLDDQREPPKIARLPPPSQGELGLADGVAEPKPPYKARPGKRPRRRKGA